MDLDQIWQSTLGEMEVQLSKAHFVPWMKNSRLIDKKDGTLYVALPNNFAKEWVESKYQKNLLGILRNFDGSREEDRVRGRQQDDPAGAVSVGK